MKKFISFILNIFIAALLYSQSGNYVSYPYDNAKYPVDFKIDVKHMKAVLDVLPSEKKFTGYVEYDFKPFLSGNFDVSFDTQDITVQQVKSDNKEIRFKQEKDEMIISFENMKADNSYKLYIKYEAFPQHNLNFIGWDDPENIKRKQIWAHGPSAWIPVLSNSLSNRLTTELKITVDSAYKVFTTGKRLSIETKGNKTVWHYKMENPHVFYLMVFVVGEYEFETVQTNQGITLENWYYPGMKEKLGPTYYNTEKMFEFYHTELGVHYPWGETYRQIPLIDYLWGAVEGTGAVVFGDFYLQDKKESIYKSYELTNCHEMGHQWFGVYTSFLTGKSGSRNRWLSESFATYYTKLYTKKIYGNDRYEYEKLSEEESAFDEAKKNSFPIAHSQAGGNRIYQKGSLVLGMLRNVIGDEAFQKGITYYLNKHKYDIVYTEDLLEAFRESTGLSLGWFWEQWILKGGEPHYKISWSQKYISSQKRSTQIVVEQIHELNEATGLFNMPIDFEVYYKDGEIAKKRVWVSKQTEIIEIENPANKEILFVIFDAGNKTLCKMTFERSFEELSEQFQKAEQMIDRYEALTSMASFPAEKKRDIYLKAYEKETFFLIKSEIIKQLGEDKDSNSLKLLSKAIKSNDFQIRKAAVDYVSEIPSELKKDYETLLADSSNYIINQALIKLSASFPENIEKYLEKTKTEKGWWGLNVRITWLETAILNGKNEYLPELVKYASNSYEFRTQINAMKSLLKLNYLNQEYIADLFYAYFYFNPKVSNQAKESLEYYLKQAKYKDLIYKYYKSKTWTESQKTKIEEIL